MIGVEEHIVGNIEQDYRDKDEKIYRCILHKIQSSEHTIRWNFWKENILRFDEGGCLVDILETRFPLLSTSLNEHIPTNEQTSMNEQSFKENYQRMSISIIIIKTIYLILFL